MFSVEREVDQRSAPTEAELQGQLQLLNRRLLTLNEEAGQIESERRSTQHKLKEVSKALQSLQAGRMRRELATASGTGPRSGGRW